MKDQRLSLSKTSPGDKKLAMEFLQPVRVLMKSSQTSRFFVQAQGSDSEEALEIPRPALEMLVEILSNMAEGKEDVFAPVDQDLTTQQAADLIGVSRPYLIDSLLETGKIPFIKVGRHRRVRRSDVIAFKEQQRKITEESLQFLADEAQELNLGY